MVPTKNPGRLKFETAVTRDDLQSVNSVEISADGRFVYATPWQLGAVVVFQRDSTNGHLKHAQTLKNPLLQGDTGIAFASSGKLAVAACFGSRSVVLMNCDTNTGKLKILHSVHHGEEDVPGVKEGENLAGLEFPIEAIFSPDARYVYVLNGNGVSLTIFRINNDKLEFVESTSGEDGSLDGARGLALSPDGKLIYVAAATANALNVLERNPQTGSVKVKQTIWDEDPDVHGLAGVFGVTTSRDGQFIYTTSGRFSGDSAVSVFQRGTDGKLKVVHELIAEREELPSFLGGNRLILSPDEKHLYAVATRSGTVASFDRDPKTGRLKILETFTDDDNNGITAGAAGVAISPDGKHVYIAAEGQATISIYRRN
ncbi:MAG TPA: beta-propeller fold lactonase family protein [Verrucomicrobiae bacterium]